MGWSARKRVNLIRYQSGRQRPKAKGGADQQYLVWFNPELIIWRLASAAILVMFWELVSVIEVCIWTSLPLRPKYTISLACRKSLYLILDYTHVSLDTDDQGVVDSMTDTSLETSVYRQSQACPTRYNCKKDVKASGRNWWNNISPSPSMELQHVHWFTHWANIAIC